MGHIAKLHDLFRDAGQLLRGLDQLLELFTGAWGKIVDLDNPPAGCIEDP
jgi:hypothetical protein